MRLQYPLLGRLIPRNIERCGGVITSNSESGGFKTWEIHPTRG
ncbi:hypothetical protein HMPREF0294_2050 [Corynebacterium glucuronolyticum ATCC 51867]|nr:hypothetical protein HMPREF0294_2050 [Corynebacterium glucuronolyticum ATCC 51867]